MSQTKITNWLVTQLAERLEVEPASVHIEKDFVDYGLSSLEAVNLSGELEKFLGLRLSPTLLWDYPNIKTLSEYLAKYDSNHKNQKLELFTENDNKEIAPEHYHFELDPKYIELQRKLQEIQSLGISNPFFIPQEGLVNDKTVVGGRELINYATYNYLGMCGEPLVSHTAKEAIDQYGTSAGASRLLSGEKPLHQQLEQEIANFIGAEASLVFVGGYTTNETTIGHLFGKNDLILYDTLSHNSIIKGCLLSGASLVNFPHNDWEALDKILSDRRNHYQKVLIVVEGIYSTDGDIPNLPKFIEIKKHHQAFLMVDEAHSIGVLGKNGGGIREYFEVNASDVDIWMGTLSKSFASCGGYIAGSKALIEYLKYTAPGFVYSVGISPPNAAAALAAIRLLKAQPERVQKLQENAKLFTVLAQEKELNIRKVQDSPVIPLIIGNSLQSVQLSHNLFQRGINVPFMVYPSVPKDEARLRFFITCQHTEEQIIFTIETLVEELSKINSHNNSFH